MGGLKTPADGDLVGDAFAGDALVGAFLAGDLLGDRCLAGDLLRDLAIAVVFPGDLLREAAPLILKSTSFFLGGLRPRAAVAVVFFFCTLDGDFFAAGFAVVLVVGRPRERVSTTMV